MALIVRAARRTTDVNPNARSVSVEMAGWWSDQLGVPVSPGTPTAHLPRPSNTKAIDEIKSLSPEQRAGYLKLRAAGGTHARVMRDLRGLPARKAPAKKATKSTEVQPRKGTFIGSVPSTHGNARPVDADAAPAKATRPARADAVAAMARNFVGAREATPEKVDRAADAVARLSVPQLRQLFDDMNVTIPKFKGRQPTRRELEHALFSQVVGHGRRTIGEGGAAAGLDDIARQADAAREKPVVPKTPSPPRPRGEASRQEGLRNLIESARQPGEAGRPAREALADLESRGTVRREGDTWVLAGPAAKAPARKAARTVDRDNPLANLDAAELARVAREVNVNIPSPARSAQARRRYLTEALTDHERRSGGGMADPEARARRRLADAAEKVLSGRAQMTDADMRREARMTPARKRTGSLAEGIQQAQETETRRELADRETARQETARQIEQRRAPAAKATSAPAKKSAGSIRDALREQGERDAQRESADREARDRGLRESLSQSHTQEAGEERRPAAKATPAKKATTADRERDRTERRKAAVRRYVRGESISQIAASDGRSYSSVHEDLVSSGVQLRPRGGETTRRKAETVDAAKAATPAVRGTGAARVARVAGAFHEDWRQTRRREDGSFEPRVKKTKDQAWIDAHGTDEVDIANTSYDDLPTDWQAENRAAAEVVARIVDRHGGKVDLSDPQVRQEIGDEIHKAWLSRNSWARGGELDKPFSELPADEQAKDVDQVAVAMRVLAPAKRAPAAKKATPARKAAPRVPMRGEDALDAAPAQLDRQVGLTPERAQALRSYSREMSTTINDYLRGASPVRGGEQAVSLAPRLIQSIDEAFDGSHLTADVEVWRGIGTGRGVFGDPDTWGDLTGREWTEKAYVSTTATESDVGEFTRNNGVRLRITAPKGTPAIRMTAPGDEAELLLGRGLRYRVVRDGGWGEIDVPSQRRTIRVRDLDVEVLPAIAPAVAGRAAPAKKATPAKATPRKATPAPGDGGSSSTTDLSDYRRALDEGLSPRDATAYAGWVRDHPGRSIAQWRASRQEREQGAATPDYGGIARRLRAALSGGEFDEPEARRALAGLSPGDVRRVARDFRTPDAAPPIGTPVAQVVDWLIEQLRHSGGRTT